MSLHLPYFQSFRPWHATCILPWRKEANKMKTKLMAMALMAGSTMFAGVRFGVGVGIGVPVPAPIVVAQPPCPGPGYVWTNGVWIAPHYGRYWGGGRVVRGYGRGFRR